MTRLDDLRTMRDFIDREIDAELRLQAAPLGSDSAIQRAAELYGIAPAEVISGSRRPHVVKARQGAAWLLRSKGLSLPQIGFLLGCHHTTVLHACRKIDASPSTRALLLGLEAVA